MHSHRLPKSLLVEGTLYYIELPSRFELDTFLAWMDKQPTPFSIYLNGISYTFSDQRMRDMFMIGFRAGMEAYDIVDNSCIEDD